MPLPTRAPHRPGFIPSAPRVPLALMTTPALAGIQVATTDLQPKGFNVRPRVGATHRLPDTSPVGAQSSCHNATSIAASTSGCAWWRPSQYRTAALTAYRGSGMSPTAPSPSTDAASLNRSLKVMPPMVIAIRP